jgi:hypothetical protein
VSCPRANDCVAVGGSPSAPLVERWNGRAWEIQPAPSPAGAQSSSLAAVSCVKPKACTAVGSYTPSRPPLAQATLAERWNGRVWEIQPTPNATGAQSSSLDGVSCPNRHVCTAVGHSFTNSIPYGVLSTLAERWNGRRWEIQATPNPTDAHDTQLYGVSCPKRRVCTAVGTSISAIQTTLAESWSGATWAIEPSPNPPQGTGVIESSLFGVSCPTRRACTAVGDSTVSGPNGVPGVLAERFDGTTWQIQPISLMASFPFLAGVSCSTVSACMAVGGEGFRFFGATLAETWAP